MGGSNIDFPPRVVDQQVLPISDLSMVSPTGRGQRRETRRKRAFPKPERRSDFPSLPGLGTVQCVEGSVQMLRRAPVQLMQCTKFCDGQGCVAKGLLDLRQAFNKDRTESEVRTTNLHNQCGAKLTEHDREILELSGALGSNSRTQAQLESKVSLVDSAAGRVEVAEVESAQVQSRIGAGEGGFNVVGQGFTEDGGLMKESERRVVVGGKLQLTLKALYSLLRSSMEKVGGEGVARLRKSSTGLQNSMGSFVQTWGTWWDQGLARTSHRPQKNPRTPYITLRILLIRGPRCAMPRCTGYIGECRLSTRHTAGYVGLGGNYRARWLRVCNGNPVRRRDRGPRQAYIVFIVCVFCLYS